MLSQGCPLRQEAALPQAVRSGCSHPNLFQVLLTDTGNNAFTSTKQPLSAESCCCSLKSSQEQSVLSHPSKHLCASGGTDGCSDGTPSCPVCSELPRGTCSQNHPLRVSFSLSNSTLGPHWHHSPTPAKPAQTNPLLTLFRGRHIHQSPNKEEHTSLFVLREHQLEGSQAITKP